MSQSGAHVEVDRNSAANGSEKIIHIRGNPGQIHSAIAMIQQTVGQQVNDHYNWLLLCCWFVAVIFTLF